MPPECLPQRLPRGQRALAPALSLSEADGVRYLHFGSEWVQGAMRLRRPFHLELEYQSQMMAPLLFCPRPSHVVQLGLGAAALTKFCWRHLPRTRVTAVEWEPEVIAAARRWFRLPPDDERLRVVAADARRFVGDPRHRGGADWVQVDLYDAQARGPVYDDVAFYRACRKLLRPRGVVAVNLFGRSFASSRSAISAAFGGRIWALPTAATGNQVVLGFAADLHRPYDLALRRSALAVQRRYGLPAVSWLAGLE
ncbi:MAG: spermidine synthase [Burkholderiales bacterium]|nr:spermidine synthase [Burkholderiales bacterium]